ncbi:hypothetical protein Hanom_Chr13g01226041 [Helianthus anomalus]
MGFQIPPSPNQDQFYKEKLPNSIPFHSMKRTLPKILLKRIFHGCGANRSPNKRVFCNKTYCNSRFSGQLMVNCGGPLAESFQWWRDHDCHGCGSR